MTTINSPYATSDLVALFQRNLLLGGSDFNPNTALPKATIDTFILWVSSAIDMHFTQAGYCIPFQTLTGETWPDHQTYYLQLLTCAGVASYITPALKPAPGVGPGRGSGSGNVFKDLYDEELRKIWDGRITQARFRALYYLGTAAENQLLEPVSPKSDFMEGKVDSARYMNFWQFTELQRKVNDYALTTKDIRWDYMFSTYNKGLGDV